MCRTTSTYILSSTALLRDGVQRMLSKTQFRVLGAGRRFEDLRISAKRSQPALFILLLNNLQDSVEDAIRQIHDLAPGSRIVLLTPSSRAADVMSALRLGANGYLVETISADALLKSLDVVMADGIVLPQEVLQELAVMSFSDVPSAPAPVNGPPEPAANDQSPPLITTLMPASFSRAPDMPALSDREGLILRALIRGVSNKHIARELDIAEATVKVHVKAILRKIRVRNRTQAAIWALSNGEVPSLPAQPPPAATLMVAAEA